MKMKMKMRHTHTCHSQARVRANRDKRATWMETSFWSSVLSFESCCCHQVFRRHDAAVQLETNRWPALKKRRVGKPTSDEQCTQALCDWVATLEALLRHLLGWDNRMIADTATMAGREQEGKAMNREMLAMCSFPFCEGSAAVLMQPTFDRGRATWHDAQIQHTMDPPFDARWTGCASSARSRRP